MTITNATIHASTGDGLRNDGEPVKLRNSIIAGSSGSDCAATLSENVNNYIEDGGCSPSLSSSAGAINLGALSGSPAYHPLQAGSPALDAGNAAVCTEEDQAGTARPAGDGCDIGAHEKPEELQVSLQQSVIDAPQQFVVVDSDSVEETSTATATDTVAPTETSTPTATNTALPSATNTATRTITPTLAPRSGCVNVGPTTYWLFPPSNFLSGTITMYASDQCEAAGSSTQAIGADGYVVTALGEAAAQAMCAAAHADEREFTARQQTFNLNLYLCVGVAPTNTATLTATNTATLAPREGCVNVGPGTYWLFPASNFLSGTITVYASDQCEAAGSSTQAIGADGYVVTALGEAAAQAMCAAAHADEREFTARQQAFNLNLYLCVGVAPTNTAIPPSNTPITPTATNTLIPPTNTAIPQTLSDPRAIAGVRLSSVNPGELSVEWDAPGETVRDYRLRWEKVGEDYRSWTDLDYNAFPKASSYTIVGLEDGARYKLMVRARFDVGSGPWAQEVRADVMAAVSAPQLEAIPPTNTTIPPTNTAIPPTNTAIPPTNTAIPPTNTAIPPTNTAIPPTNTAIPPTNTAIPPTNTAIPPTNTAIPPTATAIPPTATAIPPTATDAPVSDIGPREIRSVRLQGDPNGAFDVSWTVPTDKPVDYRISWAVNGEDYLSWRDSSGNEYPVANAYTVTGLDVNVCYKVRVRSRYDGSAGGWTEVKGKINGAC